MCPSSITSFTVTFYSTLPIRQFTVYCAVSWKVSNSSWKTNHWNSKIPDPFELCIIENAICSLLSKWRNSSPNAIIFCYVLKYLVILNDNDKQAGNESVRTTWKIVFHACFRTIIIWRYFKRPHSNNILVTCFIDVSWLLRFHSDTLRKIMCRQKSWLRPWRVDVLK